VCVVGVSVNAGYDDAHVAELDVDRAQVGAVVGRAGQNVELWEVADGLPLLFKEDKVADEHDGLELVVVVVAGAQWQDKVAEAQDRRLGVGEDADDDVVGEEVFLVGSDCVGLDELLFDPVEHAR